MLRLSEGELISKTGLFFTVRFGFDKLGRGCWVGDRNYEMPIRCLSFEFIFLKPIWAHEGEARLPLQREQMKELCHMLEPEILPGESVLT